MNLTELLSTAPDTRDQIGHPEPFGRGKMRKIASRWIVGPGQDSFGDEPGRIVLDMSTRHDKDRKTLTTTLYVMLETTHTRVKPDGTTSTYTSEKVRLSFGTEGECCTIERVACERFSAKAMREAHASALRYVATHPDVVADAIQQGVKTYQPAPV